MWTSSKLGLRSKAVVSTSKTRGARHQPTRFHALYKPHAFAEKEILTQQVRDGILVMDLGCYSGPGIELAGDAVDAWKLVSPFVSEEIL